MKYLKALCRKIPQSIIDFGLRKRIPSVPFNYELAVKQHEQYINALRNAGIKDVTILEGHEVLPDCVFVEDLAIVIGSTALITHPGLHSTKLETNEILKHFVSDDLIKTIHIMNESACCDGRDVLFTGKEIFVGISERTNLEGMETIKKIFADFPVHSLNIGPEEVHLKSFSSMVGDNGIAFGKSNISQRIKKELISKAHEKYDIYDVPEDYAANAIFANDVLIHRSADEFPESMELFNKLPIKSKISLNCSELMKIDGALTCCSILY